MPFRSVDLEKVYATDPDLKRENVEALLEWNDKQPHLPKINELQAILFLHSCYYQIELAKTTVDNFFTIRTQYPDLFSLSLDDPLVEDTIKNVSVIAPLSYKSHDGCTVIYSRLVDARPEKYHVNSQAKVWDFSALLEVSLNGPGQGIRFVMDTDGSVIGHLAKFNMTLCRRFAHYFQEALPLRVKGIHIIHVPFFVDKVTILLKLVVKKSIYELVHFHSSMDTLFKFVPQEALPSDLGGQSPSIASLRAVMYDRFYGNSEFFQEYSQQVVDGSKRPAKTNKNMN